MTRRNCDLETLTPTACWAYSDRVRVRSDMKDRIIESFEDRHRQLWGRHTVKLRHALSQNELFTETGLAGLIDSLPKERVAVNTMEREGHRLETWSYCDRGGHKGKDILGIVC